MPLGSGHEGDEDQMQQYMLLRQVEVEVEVKLKVRISDSTATKLNICECTHIQETSSHHHPKTPIGHCLYKASEGEQAERTARRYIPSCWEAEVNDGGNGASGTR